MKFALGVFLGLACCVVLWLAFGVQGNGGEAPSPPSLDASRPQDNDELERRVARLEAEIERLALLLARAPVPQSVPSTFVASPADFKRGGDGFDVRWYLNQYVRSFDAGGEGSEYFRLAVDAYALELLHEICGHVRDASAHPLLRARLAAILGTPRFARQGYAIDALLALLRGEAGTTLAIAALDALRAVGDDQTGITLERMVWGLGSAEVKKRALAVLVQLDGPDANRALQRLFASATATADKALVIAALSAADAEAALAVFEQASLGEVPLRLQAAHSIHRFRGEPFKAFIDKWLGYEQDAQVRRALNEARSRMSEIRPYAAQKAAGPPDANPAQDHPNAWATQSAEMGRQWLEVAYKPARRASAVRIHEVCVAGEVVQVLLIDEGGRAHEVWAGADPTTTPGVFEVRFAQTGYRVKAVRIVLDTNKRPGWSEIDAVELVGPDGNAWASDATASSSYGG
jgi:hypothetical protein